jgi:hypothetical protein
LREFIPDLAFGLDELAKIDNHRILQSLSPL